MNDYLTLIKLSANHRIKSFDCGNDDLNEFLFQDAIEHSKQLLAITYLYEGQDYTKAYFSVLNDSIRIQDVKFKNRFKKIVLQYIPLRKRGYRSYPAVKVGRFAVNKDFHNKKVGTEIMDYIKVFFINKNKTGCRFIIVDAYRDAVGFYRKNGFNFLTEENETEDTRLMYFDLKLVGSSEQVAIN
ncbi:MAG: GNAT family N-acetyltransferase [Candidatus Magnetoovum sp. WYHC-5]|nr:GNAT family N-acetyltransferase [Candidatus Magnetoovum sp. WYHC-5]